MADVNINIKVKIENQYSEIEMIFKFSASSPEKMWKKFWSCVYKCDDCINDIPLYEIVWEQMNETEKEQACKYFPSRYIVSARRYLCGRLGFWREHVPAIRKCWNVKDEYENIDQSLDEMD